MKNQCILCGGKLQGGVCTECGLDNRKSDKMYRNVLNHSECKEQELTHVHEDNVEDMSSETEGKRESDEKAEKHHQFAAAAQKAAETFRLSQSPSRPYTARRFSARTSGNKNTALMIAGALFVIGLGCYSAISNEEDSFTDNANYPVYGEGEDAPDFDSEEDFNWDYDENYNPYEGIEEELEEVGEHWEQQLPAGVYVVGVDIPEGEYTLNGQEGSSFGVFDKTHGVFVNESFGVGEYKINGASGVELFAGAIVCVDGFHEVAFLTDNGQVQELSARLSNPLTETCQVSGEAVAGVDFPAGTYDIAATGGEFGSLYVESRARTEEDPYPFSIGTLLEENPTDEYPEYCSVYRNVVLPEGAVITTEGFTASLTPSPGIISEDYAAFYENVY